MRRYNKVWGLRIVIAGKDGTNKLLNTLPTALWSVREVLETVRVMELVSNRIGT